jgi:hypothetical protein
MINRPNLLLILLAISCSDSRKALRPNQNSNLQNSQQADASKDSGSDKALIKEVGSETNPATAEPTNELQWAKTSGNGNDPANTGAQQTDQIEISKPVPVVQGIGTSRIYRYALRSNEGFSGIIDLSAELDGLAKIDPEKKISVVLSPHLLQLEGGRIHDFTVTVTIDPADETQLQVGTSGKFRLRALAKDGPSAKVDVSLSISDCTNQDFSCRSSARSVP